MLEVDLVALGDRLLAFRAGFAVVSALFVWQLSRRGRPAFLLALVLIANAFIWAQTVLPLARPYALGESHDRAGNMQLAAVVAEGRPFYESAQTGQYSIEPGWGLVAAAVSGFDSRRLLSLYSYFSLAAPLLVALGIFYGFGGRASGLDSWDRAVAAYFGTLLVARGIDFSEYFSDPWAMMFLLKPNHALGLALAPLYVRLQAEARDLRGRLLAGLLLGLIGWLCVFHMVFLWAALFCFVALGVAERPRLASSAARLVEAAPALVVSAVVTSPYVFVLLFRFPAGQPGPRFGNPASEALLLWPTFQSGLIFPVALIGLLLWFRRGEAQARWWQALFAGGFAFWLLLILLGYSFRARERDELLYWLRFSSAMVAGAFSLEILRQLERRLFDRTFTVAQRAALLVALTFPFTSVFWWNPLRMDRYFKGSLSPIPLYMRAPGEYLRSHARPEDVVAGDSVFAKFVSVFSGRRVFLSENLNNPPAVRQAREARQQRLLGPASEACAVASAEGIRYLVITPSWLDEAGVPVSRLDTFDHLKERVRVQDPAGAFIALFEVTCGGGRS